jgi:PAS domain S-box-containing protein
MNPFTAIGLLLAAGALVLAAHPSERTTRPRQICSALVIALGSTRLLDGWWNAPTPVDLLLFPSRIRELTPVPRMAHSTAICLLTIGIALLLYRFDGRNRTARWVIVPAGIFALMAALGYAYQAEWLFNLPALHPMALNTALGVLALCLGITALPPPIAPTDKLVQGGAVGAVARRLIPAAFLIPFVLGYLRVLGERTALFDLGFGTAAFVVLTAIILGCLSYWSVHRIMLADQAQHALQQEVRSSEARLFQILEALPVGVFVVNREGNPYYSNRVGTRLLGRGAVASTRVEEIPEQYQVFIAGTDQTLPLDRIPVVRALAGEDVYTTELEIHRPDRVVPLEVWASPIRNEENVVEFGVAAFNDITERQATLRQIDQLNGELKHQVNELGMVNRELETFSYSVSHDLRAPLRAVDGFSELLESDYAALLPAEAVRLLTRIRSNVRRMGALIDDLLRFSRLSRKGLETTAIDMESLVANIMDDLRRQWTSAPDIIIGSLPVIPGDKDLLRQVWINLIDNAVKYSSKRSDPRVEIHSKQDHSEVIFTVRDNGVGFDMAYADKLFGVFQRLHRQDEFEGTGVGLAIVQRVIHRHGGRIWAEAEPGRGATFHFSLPAGESHVAV